MGSLVGAKRGCSLLCPATVSGNVPYICLSLLLSLCRRMLGLGSDFDVFLERIWYVCVCVFLVGVSGVLVIDFERRCEHVAVEGSFV